MTLAAFIVVTLTVFTIAELAWASHIRARRARLRHLARVESTRSYFAQLRNNLVRLALDRKIDTASRTFDAMYTLQTLIIRAPDQYETIAKLAFQALFINPPKKNYIGDEALEWNDEVRENVLGVGDGLHLLVADYSPLRRFVDRIESRAKKVEFVQEVGKQVIKIEKLDRRRREIVESLLQSAEKLSKLSSTRASGRPVAFV